MFYDTTTQLKVTTNIPGVTTKPKSVMTAEASRHGHIQEISEHEYHTMLSKITPLEEVIARAEHAGVPSPKGKELEEAVKVIESSRNKAASKSNTFTPIDLGEIDNDAKLQALTDRVNALKISNGKKQQVLSGSMEEIETYLEENEKK